MKKEYIIERLKRERDKLEDLVNHWIEMIEWERGMESTRKIKNNSDDGRFFRGAYTTRGCMVNEVERRISYLNDLINQIEREENRNE